MNERVKDEKAPARIGPVAESHHVDLHGVGVRIDQPHASPAAPVLREPEWQNLDHFVQDKPAAPTVTSSLPNLDTQFLDDLGQRARQWQNQIQAEKASLAQHGQALRAEQISLEEERRRLNLRITNDQAQLDTQRAQHQKQEALLAERMTAFEVQFKKFDAERESLHQQRSEVDRQKHRIREEIVSEIQVQRQDFEQAKNDFKQDCDQLQALKKALELRLAALATENEQALRAERQKLWATLTEEWEQRKIQFEQEQATWRKNCELETTELDREKAMFEAAVESANAEFLQSRESLAAEFSNRRELQLNELAQQRRDWEQTRSDEQHQLAERIEAEQTHQILLREELIAELAAMREQQIAELQTEQARWLESKFSEEQAQLAARESLQRELIDAHEQMVKVLQLEREEWNATLAQAQADLAARREQHSTELQHERDDWDQSRQMHLDEIERKQAEMVALIASQHQELNTKQEQHESALLAERSEWEQIRDLERLQFESQQRDWLVSRDAQHLAAREALELEFIAQREQQATALQAEREEWNRTLQADKSVLQDQQADFLRERTMIENRIRFQQDHLEKSRIEFEQAQNEFRRERQSEHQRIEELNMQMIRRLKQIDLYRSSVDAREKSLDREQEVFNKTRKSINSTADFDRLNFQAEKHAWDQERQIQITELRRQQETLAARAETLEGRQTRLDKLRAELEETHRTTLEMRLAVEEAWAQLAQTSGPDEARQRVEEVRQALAGYYQQMHETLNEQRHEHVEVQSKFERQRAEFTEERQRLTNWLTARDEELRVGEERLRIAANEAANNHTKWLTARDRWLLEKTEAEHLIRRLLASLGENSRDQSVEQDSLLRLDRMNLQNDDVLQADKMPR